MLFNFFSQFACSTCPFVCLPVCLFVCVFLFLFPFFCGGVLPVSYVYNSLCAQIDDHNEQKFSSLPIYDSYTCYQRKRIVVITYICVLLATIICKVCICRDNACEINHYPANNEIIFGSAEHMPIYENQKESSICLRAPVTLLSAIV